MTHTEPGHRSPGLLRIHSWLVLLTVLLTVGAALAIGSSRHQDVTATAEVVALATPSSAGPPLPVDMGTEREVAKSGEVAARAADDLGVSPQQAQRGLSVAVATDTDVLLISYTASDDHQALAGASAFTRAFVEYRNSTQQARAARVITDPQIRETGGMLGSWQVIGVVAVGIGLALGAAAAWAWDTLSGRVRAPRELEGPDLPVFGMVDGAAAGFGRLAARLTGVTGRRRRGVLIVVTAAEAGAGAAPVAVGLARSLAGFGRRVTLVDAEGAAGGPAAELGLSAAAVGFRDVVEGRCEADQALVATSPPGLRVMGSGGRAESGTLDLDALRIVLAQLASRSVVVLHAPPACEAPEVALYAGDAAVVVLVVRLGATSRAAARQAVDVVQPACRPHSSVLGWVVTTRALQPTRRARHGKPSQRHAVPGPQQPVASRAAETRGRSTRA